MVVYESMFGGTHELADAVGDGLRAHGPCDVLHASKATAEHVAAADLVVVGAPTMGHTISTPQSRDAARAMVEHPKPGATPLSLDDGAPEPGLREWFTNLGSFKQKQSATFDTRVDMSELLTGHASHTIARRMKRKGFVLAAKPRSFLVDKHYVLLPDQCDLARAWADGIARKLTGVPLDGELIQSS